MKKIISEATKKMAAPQVRTVRIPIPSFSLNPAFLRPSSFSFFVSLLPGFLAARYPASSARCSWRRITPISLLKIRAARSANTPAIVIIHGAVIVSLRLAMKKIGTASTRDTKKNFTGSTGTSAYTLPVCPLTTAYASRFSRLKVRNQTGNIAREVFVFRLRRFSRISRLPGTLSL